MYCVPFPPLCKEVSRPCVYIPSQRRLACGLRAAAPYVVLHPAGVLASAAASQMGTPQEDESIFAILVAGDTPNNLHQDKLGEYVR